MAVENGQVSHFLQTKYKCNAKEDVFIFNQEHLETTKFWIILLWYKVSMFDVGHSSSKMHLWQLHMDTAKAGMMETGFKVTN